MLRVLGAVLLVAVLCLGVGLAYTNAGFVTFDYLFGQTQIRLVLVLLLAFTIGVVLSMLLCGIRILGLHADIRRLRRRQRELDTELKNLRNLPLRDVP